MAFKAILLALNAIYGSVNVCFFVGGLVWFF